MDVDLGIGDRRCACRGPMEPIAVWVRSDGEWAIVRRCRRCGRLRSNRVAGDDNEIALMSLAEPPFPPERLGTPIERNESAARGS